MINEYDIINNTYQIIGQIGKGGVGIIYLAEHLHLRKKVVLKKIKTNKIDDLKVRQEADILKSLHHMYLPQVYDFIEYNSDIYTVIDYIEGHDLDYYIKKGAVFGEDQLIKWMMQLCDVLSYLHNHNPVILHNDIKPANVIINENGDICLIDFNISSYINDTVYGFTAQYASPEQYYNVLRLTRPGYGDYNVPITGQSDLYSVGAMFYNLASHQPIRVDNVINHRQALFSQLPVPYSKNLCSIIDRLIEPDTNIRYGSAEQLKNDLIRLNKGYSLNVKLRIIKIMTFIMSCLIAVTGVLMVYSGVHEIRMDDYNRDYKKMCFYYDKSEYDKAIDLGWTVLSDENTIELLSGEEKAALNYLVGMSYYHQGDYGTAQEFVSEAVSLSKKGYKKHRDYLMDQAIIFAWLNDFQTAEDILKTAQNEGLDNDKIEFVLAELDYVQGDYSSVTERYENMSEDILSYNDINERMCILAGDAYGKLSMPQWDDAINAYDRAYAINQSREVIAKLGNAYRSRAEKQKTGKDEINDLKTAAEYYEQIYEGRINNSVEDIISLVNIYIEIDERLRGSDRLSKAIEILEDRLPDNENDYRVYLQLALCCHQMNSEDKASDYCKRAIELYNSTSQLPKKQVTSNDKETLVWLQNRIQRDLNV